MSIEKMVLLKIVGSVKDMNAIMKELILSENVHLNLNVEQSDAYSNYYLIHQYESEIVGSKNIDASMQNIIECSYEGLTEVILELAKGLGVELSFDKKILADNYNIQDAYEEYIKLNELVAERITEISRVDKKLNELIQFKNIISTIQDTDLDFDKIADLNYFGYDIGTLSKENKARLKRSYETISAIAMRIGIINNSVDDLYMIIYPKQIKEETDNLLKSLNWNSLQFPDDIFGTPKMMIYKVDSIINDLNQIKKSLVDSIVIEKSSRIEQLNRLYSIFKLEDTASEIIKHADFGDNIFAFDVWIEKSKLKDVKKSIEKISGKYVISEKSAEELGSLVVPPTKLKNNWLFKPFETIIEMYSLPSYNEIDPTPFLAITFCLAFGIMFGDIGQGFVYFLAGLLLSKKIGAFGEIITRLGLSSMVFGLFYGSLFGLEKHQLPWLPGLLEGGPLSSENIPKMLGIGIGYGVIVLTAAYMFGIANSLKAKDIKEGIFGKNGVFGYIFFISFIFSILSLVKFINIALIIPLSILLVSISLVILKEPLANLITNHKPLFHEGAGAYFTESIFEAVETVLAVLSNSISFVRVGAFALNHAGLFLAFLVISEMINNPILKVLILVIGNVLILTLEGVIVFIQGLRLQYYEMFSKFYRGDGAKFKPLKIAD